MHKPFTGTALDVLPENLLACGWIGFGGSLTHLDSSYDSIGEKAASKGFVAREGGKKSSSMQAMELHSRYTRRRDNGLRLRVQ